MPDKLTPTADENRQMSVLMEDINTFVLEETTKMIMGTSTYTFETFRQKILDMGIDQALAIEQQEISQLAKDRDDPQRMRLHRFGSAASAPVSAPTGAIL